MTRTLLFAFLLTTTVAAVSVAGTLEGKVSGASGQSVVYVDTVSGKTFPPPSEHKVIDQKGLSFDPHIAVVTAEGPERQAVTFWLSTLASRSAAAATGSPIP